MVKTLKKIKMMRFYREIELVHVIKHLWFIIGNEKIVLWSQTPQTKQEKREKQSEKKRKHGVTLVVLLFYCCERSKLAVCSRTSQNCLLPCGVYIFETLVVWRQHRQHCENSKCFRWFESLYHMILWYKKCTDKCIERIIRSEPFHNKDITIFTRSWVHFFVLQDF